MNIQSTKDITNLEKFRFMVYGYSGVGKTQLIGTIPGKTLVLNTDKGMKTLRKSVIDYVSANTWKEVVDFLNFIKTEECLKTYEWIVFDSVSAMAQLLFVDLTDNKKFAGYDLWNQYGNFVTKFMLMLRDQQNYHTLAIFEAEDKEDDNGVVGKGFTIKGKSGTNIPNFFDEVFALRVNKEGDRILQTSTSLGWVAKDRSQTLEKNEPADLNSIMNKILTA